MDYFIAIWVKFYEALLFPSQCLLWNSNKKISFFHASLPLCLGIYIHGSQMHSVCFLLLTVINFWYFSMYFFYVSTYLPFIYTKLSRRLFIHIIHPPKKFSLSWVPITSTVFLVSSVTRYFRHSHYVPDKCILYIRLRQWLRETISFIRIR